MMISIAGREIDEDDEQAEALLKRRTNRRSGRSASAGNPLRSSRSPISASIIS